MHLLVAIFSSPPFSWVIDIRASNHMVSLEDIVPSLNPCTNPNILRDASVQVIHLAKEEYSIDPYEEVVYNNDKGFVYLEAKPPW